MGQSNQKCKEIKCEILNSFLHCPTSPIPVQGINWSIGQIQSVCYKWDGPRSCAAEIDAAVSATQYSGEESTEGKVGGLGEFRIYNPLLPALLEAVIQSSRYSQLLEEQALNLFPWSP